MASEIVIPEVGEVGMDVTFVRWLKASGDEVYAGEPIFEVDTAKAVLEVEAIDDGRLADLRVTEGELVTPHQVVAVLLAPGEDLSMQAPSPVPAPAAEDQPTGASPSPRPTPDASPAGSPAVGATTGRVAASPKARRLAKARGLDLATVTGTGREGLVTERDVEAANTAMFVPGVTRSAAVAPTDISPAGTDPHRARIRRATAELASASWRAIPHISLHMEADVTDVMAMGQPTAVLAAAVVQALIRHPQYNLGWGPGGRLYQRDSVDLGILVDTDRGLLLPAVRQAGRLDLGELEEAIRGAARRARDGALSGDDAAGHSVTLSNLGMFSVDGFIGVIPSPDVLLISTGRIRTAPRWREDGFVPRKVVEVTLSADHRALDGADGGRFLSILERILGDPEVLA